MPRKPSDLTCTDLFCGAGGSSVGAAQAGARLRMALNHWDLAIETHNSNFPDADHDCTDISATDPRRYPSTHILIASPECTNHSLAKGKKRKRHQREIFVPAEEDPSAVRSRATMWDVPRFAEFHDYELIIVENVIDVRRWVMYDAWIQAMHALGYRHRGVYLNSMFAHPTPQSRDRIYVVFWKEGNPAPDLAIEPPAPCASCGVVVEAVQSWKPDRTWGRYDRQYVYLCPRCTSEVEPYYYAAINALDFAVEAERIGDRKRPLADRTMERIRYGLDEYGRHPLVVRVNMTSGVECRVRSALGAPLDTQPGCNITALCSPSLGEEPGPDVPESERFVAVSGAALMTLRDHPRFVFDRLDGTLPTQVAAGQQTAVIARAPFLAQYNGESDARPIDEALPTATSRDRNALVLPDRGDPPAVEDCYFRMLQPHEIQAGMAFPGEYQVLGTKRDQVKQLGNAVTPPVMRELIRRCVQSLEGERAA